MARVHYTTKEVMIESFEEDKLIRIMGGSNNFNDKKFNQALNSATSKINRMVIDKLDVTQYSDDAREEIPNELLEAGKIFTLYYLYLTGTNKSEIPPYVLEEKKDQEKFLTGPEFLSTIIKNGGVEEVVEDGNNSTVVKRNNKDPLYFDYKGRT